MSSASIRDAGDGSGLRKDSAGKNAMQGDARIEIVVDPSLLDHFRDHMRNRNSSVTLEEQCTKWFDLSGSAEEDG